MVIGNDRNIRIGLIRVFKIVNMMVVIRVV